MVVRRVGRFAEVVAGVSIAGATLWVGLRARFWDVASGVSLEAGAWCLASRCEAGNGTGASC